MAAPAAAAAIYRRAIPATRLRIGDGAYNADGKLIPGVATTSAINAVIQPASGDQMKDLPEGIRTEANWLIWSVFDLAVDDRIVSKGIRYRVMHVWPRADGVFFRAALGRETK